MAKKCTKKRDGREEVLFCLFDLTSLTTSLCTAAPPLKKIGKEDFLEGRGGCTQATNDALAEDLRPRASSRVVFHLNARLFPCVIRPYTRPRELTMLSKDRHFVSWSLLAGRNRS